MGFQIFGQVINRAGNIAEFGHSLGSRLHTPPNFSLPTSLPPGGSGGMTKVMSCLKQKLEIYEMIFFPIVQKNCNTLFSQNVIMSG